MTATKSLEIPSLEECAEDALGNFSDSRKYSIRMFMLSFNIDFNPEHEARHYLETLESYSQCFSCKEYGFDLPRCSECIEQVCESCTRIRTYYTYGSLSRCVCVLCFGKPSLGKILER